MSTFDPIWEQLFRTQEWGKYPPEHVIRFVARNFYAAPRRADVRLLDLGSGPGANTWYMAREGFSVSAIDGSATGIERLRARLAAEGLTADARVGDFATLPWPDGSFDGVVDNASLCANPFAAAQKVVAEVERVLEPGGRFLSASFTDRTWGNGLGVEVEPGGFRDVREGPLKDRGFVMFLSRERLDRLFAPFARKQVERLSWTVEEETRLIELWCVTAQKAG